MSEKITILDTDAVCTACRYRFAHASTCVRRDEPWPTFQVDDSPLYRTPPFAFLVVDSPNDKARLNRS